MKIPDKPERKHEIVHLLSKEAATLPKVVESSDKLTEGQLLSYLVACSIYMELADKVEQHKLKEVFAFCKLALLAIFKNKCERV